ncbi:protein of unknown function (plasmid) [Azospirillum lipoferum 4B]|uniref:Uncharacterized protein n=1 Tax=Azospirillum lipoferum (strain 4B) TaxID=862719 RepID=G7ZH22_AZOL4|nr:protein of unknown function [Azospirillum lipoferum 4B]
MFNESISLALPLSIGQNLPSLGCSRAPTHPVGRPEPSPVRRLVQKASHQRPEEPSWA